jgi:hypothetical protein
MSATVPVPLGDGSAAAWVSDRTPGFGARVDHLVPAARYEQFARILHRPDQGLPSSADAGSWAVVAARYGTVVHA